MSDFDQFQREVIDAYHEKKKQRALPVELERASPTQLMNYCLALLYSGELKGDLPTLNRIFNPANKYLDLEHGIKAFGADGFKSLQNFMMGRTSKPREHVVKLLAVLIDFQPRPYETWIRTKVGDQSRPLAERQTGDEVSGHVAEVPAKKGWSTLKKPILYGMVAFSGMLGAYQIADNFDRECMYWEADRYVPIKCGEQTAGTEVIPLDKKLVKNFRKVMRPDTLTLASTGKVWYGKPTVDSIEFYTMNGLYPVNRQKKLKPATAYIIKKYVLDR